MSRTVPYVPPSHRPVLRQWLDKHDWLPTDLAARIWELADVARLAAERVQRRARSMLVAARLRRARLSFAARVRIILARHGV